MSLLLSLLLAVPAFAGENELHPISNIDNEEFSISSNEEMSLEQYYKLIDYFNNVEYSPENDSPLIVNYPEYYGGAYLDDSKKLVVFLVEEFIDSGIKTEIENIIGADVVFKEATYSFSHLMTIMERINSVMIESSQNDYIVEWMIIDKENRIQVGLLNCNEAEIWNFKKYIIDDNSIYFIKVENKAVEDINVDTGVAIGSGSSGGGSVGYRVKKGNDTGIVTAAHVVTTGTYISFNGVNFAQGTSAWQCGGSVDGVFCKSTNSSYTPTNTVNASISIVTIMRDPPAGASVIMKGRNNHSSGTIQSTNVSFPYGGATFTNLTSATYLRAGGDSGGLVYSLSGSSYYTTGVHRGTNPSNTPVFSKSTQVAMQLGVNRY